MYAYYDITKSNENKIFIITLKFESRNSSTASFISWPFSCAGGNSFWSWHWPREIVRLWLIALTRSHVVDILAPFAINDLVSLHGWDTAFNDMICTICTSTWGLSRLIVKLSCALSWPFHVLLRRFKDEWLDLSPNLSLLSITHRWVAMNMLELLGTHMSECHYDLLNAWVLNVELSELDHHIFIAKWSSIYLRRRLWSISTTRSNGFACFSCWATRGFAFERTKELVKKIETALKEGHQFVLVCWKIFSSLVTLLLFSALDRIKDFVEDLLRLVEGPFALRSGFFSFLTSNSLMFWFFLFNL